MRSWTVRPEFCRTEGQAYGVDFLGDKAIVACGTSGVHVLNINPRFETVSRIKTADRVTDVCRRRPHLHCHAEDDGLGHTRRPPIQQRGAGIPGEMAAIGERESVR